MTIKELVLLMEDYHIKYRLVGDTICAYVSKYSNDYDTLRICEGGIAINGRVADVYEWLNK